MSGFYFVPFLFTVKEEHEVEEGRLVSYPIILSCGPLVPEGNWDFQHEDPMLYLQGNLWDKARREWPEFPYPQAEEAPTTPTKDTPKYSREEMDSLLKIHHQFTKLILRLGVDPCKAFKEQNVKNILQHIDANDLDCKVCGKSYTNASRMRLHIQQKHIGVTNYQCTTCYKYYVNEQTLATHISRAHDPNKVQFTCGKCKKGYPTEGDLRRHLPSHEGPKFVCKFEDLGCTRKYVYIRGKRDHEKKCTYNPVKPQPQFECEECGRKYFDKRIRDRHLREVHKIKSSVVVTPTSVEDPGQGEFQCDQCSRRFLDKSHLNVHINRVHKKKGKEDHADDA